MMYIDPDGTPYVFYTGPGGRYGIRALQWIAKNRTIILYIEV